MPREKVGIDLKRLIFADAYDGVYARFLEERCAAPVYARVGIYDGDYATSDFGLYKGIGARRGLAVMRTGLQHAIDARAFGLLPCDLQRISLAVRTPALRGHALPDNPAVFNNHAAHNGVLARPPLLLPRQGEGFAHVMFVGFGGHQPFPLSRDDSLPNTCTSSSPRTRGEVPAVWRGMGGSIVCRLTLSIKNESAPHPPLRADFPP